MFISVARRINQFQLWQDEHEATDESLAQILTEFVHATVEQKLLNSKAPAHVLQRELVRTVLGYVAVSDKQD